AAQDAAGAARACLACHAAAALGAGGVPVPFLAGQQEEYLVKQLRNFRDGERALEPSLRKAHELPSSQLRLLAAYFAARPAELAGGPGGDAGRRLYLDGDARRNVPACAGCHGARPEDATAPTTPILHGQPAPYLAHQLRLWRSGLRDNSVDGLMNKVVEPLSDTDIEAVAAFLASAP
ncbi:c-type cytochrome, partial [uncultured Azohydromonas sp.]|uniref:c-type cytochrome n=1 Tax=uncultured Azohydromonas sp. TaxID=487342 RepID=UPI00261CF175